MINALSEDGFRVMLESAVRDAFYGTQVMGEKGPQRAVHYVKLTVAQISLVCGPADGPAGFD
jgi:hypothetical protein